MMEIRYIVLCFLLFFLIPRAHAWGLKGHQITVQIAELYLTPKAKRELSKILGKKSLSEHAYWADKIAYTSEWKHTQPWHYISITDQGEYGSLDTPTPENILSALRLCILNLSSDMSASEKKNWLKFLIHFTGDIHQPLHMGRKEDEGGNKIAVIYGKKTNLHSIWDTGFIEKQELTSEDYVIRLRSQNRRTEDLKKNFDEQVLIKENLEIRPFVYSFKDAHIDPAYEAQAVQIIEERLWTGGIRLAALLNKIFK